MLSHEFDVKTLCELCGVSRSGYYKWKKRDGAPPQNRTRILKLVENTHEKHPSHGYRWVHAYLKQNEHISVSADYIRRCFRYLGISSQTKHKAKKYKRTVKDPYPNLIFSTWDTVDRPRQVIVSDMTALQVGWYRYYELTMYFDVFTKQIIGYAVTDKRGCRDQYFHGLNRAIENVERVKETCVAALERGSGDITIFHTDQGSVYTSKAYNQIIKEHGLVRSCSRAGKPTDNPVNESLNSWIKEELYCDFGLDKTNGIADVKEVLCVWQ